MIHVFTRFFLSVLTIFLTSCSVYKQQFDCPPPAGIPCASVTEIESMIVETDKGADIIVKPEVEADNHCFWCGAQKAGCAFPSKSSGCNRKVWICSKKSPCDSTKGYYFKKADVDNRIILEPEDIFSCSANTQMIEN